MLIYHPAVDHHHCCYRLIRLLNTIGKPLSEQTLMLCDFFSLFPGQMKHIQAWPRANSKSARTIKSIPDEFEELLNTKRVFFQLKDVQKAAISNLFAKDLLRTDSNNPNAYSLNTENVPNEIKEAINRDWFITSDPYRLITNDLSKFELFGKNGLKSKSGLMEFLYD